MSPQLGGVTSLNGMSFNCKFLLRIASSSCTSSMSVISKALLYEEKYLHSHLAIASFSSANFDNVARTDPNPSYTASTALRSPSQRMAYGSLMVSSGSWSNA